MGLITKINDYATEPTLDPDIGAKLDADLAQIIDEINGALDNANIAATPKINSSKVDLTGGGYVQDTGDEITGILQHIYDTVSTKNVWRIGRASGNARIYEGVADGLWGISQNTYYTGSAWSGRDATGTCAYLALKSDGFHVYTAASASSTTVPSWTEILHVNLSGIIQASGLSVGLAKEDSIDWANAGGISQANLVTTPYSAAPGTSYITVATQKIYIPPTANSLEYYMELETDNGSGFHFGRLTVASADGTVLTAQDLSPTWNGPGTVDVSAESGWTTVNIQIKATGAGDTIGLSNANYRII